MKVQIVSDLHLEFQKTLPIIENAGADVLVIGGDTCLAQDLYRNPIDIRKDVIQKEDRIRFAMRYREFFDYVSSNWKHIIYIMGNHEHYNGNWTRTEDVMRNEFARYPNIHLLEQNKLVIDDVVFLGATMWADMNKGDPITMMSIRDMLNDYKAIANYREGKEWSRLFPQVTLEKHYETVAWLRFMLSEDKRKTFVATHHAATRQSIRDSFRGQWIVNGAFANNLDEFIIDHPHIAVWSSGHVHHAHRYYINDTLVVCNPHGYPKEITGFDSTRVIDLNNLPDPSTITNNQIW